MQSRTQRFALAAAAASAAVSTASHGQGVASERAPQSVTVTGTRAAAAPLSLDDAPTTASNLGLTLRQLPLSASVIDRDDIERRGARNALEATVTSVGVTGGLLPGSNPRYSMRGFSDNNITLLRDGIRQNTLAQSSRPVDTFVLDRIEVLKGPSSMMHGEGAVAGAVNYVSRAPSTTPATDLLASADNYRGARLGASTTGPLAQGEGAYRLTLATSRTGDGYTPRSDMRIDSLGAALSWRLNRELSASLAVDAQREDIDTWFGLPVVYDQAINTLTSLPRSTGPANTATDRLVNARIEPSTRRLNYNLADSYNQGRNRFTRLKLQWDASASTTWRATFYEAQHFLDWRNSENYVWNPNTRLVQRDLFYIRRDDTLRGLRTELLWAGSAGGQPLRLASGMDLNHNNLVRGTRAAGALPPAVFNVALDNPNSGSTPVAFTNFVPQADAQVKTLAPFVEAAFDPLPALKLVGGLRLDTIDVQRTDRLNAAASTTQSYQPLTGRLGGVWSFSPLANVYASVATSADPVQQFASITATQAALSLQKGRQLEVGFKQSTADRSLDWTLAAYRIHKRDLLTTSLVAGVSTAQAVGGQSSQGVEAALAWRPAAAWALGANLAWTCARFDDFAETVANPAAGTPGQPATLLIQRAGNTPSNVPEWTANALLNWRPAAGLELGLAVQHVGLRQANTANLIQLPAYTVLNASVQYTVAAWTLGLRGRNLGDRQYADWAINQGLQQRVGNARSWEVSARATF
jgi:iron complex outermembrane recepter protein